MKETRFKQIRLLLMATALVELAISQIHIAMITQLSIREIGFYFFLFILFGLLVLFNLTSMKIDSKGRITAYIFTTLAAVGAGAWMIKLAIDDYNVKDYVTFDVIYPSLTGIIIGIVIYGLGSIALISLYVSYNKEH